MSRLPYLKRIRYSQTDVHGRFMTTQAQGTEEQDYQIRLYIELEVCLLFVCFSINDHKYLVPKYTRPMMGNRLHCIKPPYSTTVSTTFRKHLFNIHGIQLDAVSTQSRNSAIALSKTPWQKLARRMLRSNRLDKRNL